MKIQSLSRSANGLSLSCVVATGQVTNDTIVARLITRLICKTLVRSQIFKKVVGAIDMSQQIVGSSVILFSSASLQMRRHTSATFQQDANKDRGYFPPTINIIFGECSHP